MGVRIKDIPLNDRPCERLIINGVGTLSNEELLAIIFKTGTKGNSAKDLSNELLSKVEDIKDLKNINLEFLRKIKGIGTSKACNLLACIELGKRINREVEKINDVQLKSSQLVYKFYKDRIGDLKQEHFYCVYLDNSKKIIKDKLLFIGTVNYSLVHPREVFKEAYLLGASAIICIHNHPSGNTIPSKQDIDITSLLIKAGELLGIKVIDHIIIGHNNYYSFLENGDITF